MRKFPITRLLRKNNYITQESEEIMVQSGELSPLSEIELLEMNGIIKEGQLVEFLSQTFHFPALNIEDIIIKEDVYNEIPSDIIHKLQILPIDSTQDDLTIAISDPTDITRLESLSYYTKKHVSFVIAKQSLIIKSYQLLTSQTKSLEAVESLKQEFSVDEDFKIDHGRNIDGESDAPTIQLTNSILLEAITKGASDIHIEPFEDYMVVRNRVDGILEESMRLPVSIYSALIARFKLICGMDISERRIPQEGRLEVVYHDRPVDIRFSTIPNVFGEKLVLRILEKKFLNTGIDELGFSQEEHAEVQQMLHRSNGIILVTGPTGSGKSTTLYSFLKHIKTSEKSIVTVEDPVEYTIDGFNQSQVNTKQGLTFPICLRAILRQDPDIIMIGEIRDSETAEIAVRASITGHLVLSTLHTNSAVSTISRLINMGVEPYLIADSLRGVVAQRLMRRLCPNCKEESMTTDMEQRMLGINHPHKVFHPKGCKHCNNTGYKGRFAVFEVFKVTPQIKKYLQRGHNAAEIENSEEVLKLTKLYDSGVKAVLRGDTSIQELRGLEHEE